jgi:hypothetical protein
MDSSYGLPTEGSGPRLDHEQEIKSGIQVLRQRVQAQYPAVVVGSIVRPADTTAYAAGDSVSNSTTAPTAMAFLAARFAGGGGIITAAHFLDDSNPATKPTFELWLFGGAAAPTPTNDNAAIAWSDADVANLIGVIEFLQAEVRVGSSAGNNVCTGRMGTSHTFRLPFRCDAAQQNIWGMVVVRTAYTPANAGTLRFKLSIEQE